MTEPRASRPLDGLASLIAVNITPVAGIVFLGWQPAGVLISYYVDTYIAACAVMLLLMIHVTGDGVDTPIEGWRRWGELIGSLVFLGSIIALPLALPLVFVLGGDVVARMVFDDRAFVAGLAVQVLVSVLASMRVHRQLKETHDDDRILSARGLFLAARWLVVFVVAATGIMSALGPRFGSLALIAVYAGASVYFEVFPEHAMRVVRRGNPRPMAYERDLDDRAAERRGDVNRR